MSWNDHDPANQPQFARGAQPSEAASSGPALVKALREQAVQSFLGGQDASATLLRQAADFIERNIIRPRG